MYDLNIMWSINVADVSVTLVGLSRRETVDCSSRQSHIDHMIKRTNIYWLILEGTLGEKN